MALVQVREKGAAADAPTAYVDEEWLERWPDDYEVVPEAPAAAAPAQSPAPAAEQPSEGRRRSSDF